MKTAKQRMKEQRRAAQNLPGETKRLFWKAMTVDGKTLGEASEIAGIEDRMVAAQLVLLCHRTIYVPKGYEEL